MHISKDGFYEAQFNEWMNASTFYFTNNAIIAFRYSLQLEWTGESASSLNTRHKYDTVWQVRWKRYDTSVYKKYFLETSVCGIVGRVAGI